jgi:hypothetical protein
MEDVRRLEARVEALETVLLELLREKELEEDSEYQMGRSNCDIWMEKIKVARGEEEEFDEE